MNCWDKHLPTDYAKDLIVLLDWAQLMVFFGILIHGTDQEKFVLDFTPRNECDTGRLYCEIKHAANPALASQTSPFILEVSRDRVNTTDGKHPFVESFDQSRTLASIREHETHDRSRCNVTKLGETFMVRVSYVEDWAAQVIPRIY